MAGTASGIVAGRYAIECELARGGMGVVFRALDRSTGRVLALKRSLEGGLPAVSSLFEREYRTLVSLRHPCIIEVYDYGVDEQGSFYTMELLDGHDLRARSPLGWREVCENLRDIASSLALLHSRQLLHRDVSAGNIRLTSAGRAKLIDFGTLTSFGKCHVIAGTPANVAPEVLAGADLDPRVDLYALGATGYYALTGKHAYPARSLRDLGAAWAHGVPAPPSALVAGIPSELDELMMSLLSMERSLRPSSAAELIDRLAAIAGLAPERDDRVAQSYLVSQELVGREKHWARLRSRLRRAISGHGSAVLVEGKAGCGRTALLRHFESDARVEGAAVLSVSARAHQRPMGACQALVQRALAELPDRAGPLNKRLLSAVRPSPEALEQFILALTATTPLVIVVDDIHSADTESLPVFLALTKAASAYPLLIVAALDTEGPGRDRAAVKLLNRSARRVRLRPFNPQEVEQFVRSMFGDLPSTKRLAAWLLQQSGGNPRLCAELVAHLVKQGRIHYAEGTWVLPHEFPDEDVHTVMASAVEAQLGRLRRDQRRFAECLSAHRRSLEPDLCDALREAEPELASADVARLLRELVREGVLIGDQGGYAFAQSRVRDVLYAGLDESRRCHLHRHAAQKLSVRAGGNPERELEVGWHLLLAGDRAGAYTRITQSILDVASRPDSLVRAVPELRDLYREYKRIGATPEELLQVMASLVVAGYYVDPTVHDEFGDSTAEMLHDAAGFALAARLMPWMGATPAFFIGLLGGIVRYAWSARTLRLRLFGSIVLSFVGVCAARSSVANLRLEPHTHELLLRLLAPAKRLSKHNAVRLVYDLIAIGLAEGKGAFGDVHDGFVDQLARLPHVRTITTESRHHYEAGVLCGLGRCHLFRGSFGALGCADRVDAMGGQHDRILAQFLRRSHYLYRGETAEADRAEEVLDTLAAQYGYRWAADFLAVMDFVPYHLCADIVGLKRVLHRTEQALALAPAFVTYRDVIRAMYECHRGRPEVALGLYERLAPQLHPFSHPAWSFACANRAECLNGLGRHEEALAACQEALRHVGALARVYVVAYQQLEREGALALAGLGRTDEAARQVDELLRLHRHDTNPLIMGLLHRDRARIALLSDDRRAFERHARGAHAEFSRTGNPTLQSQGHRLLEWALGPEPGDVPTSPSESKEHLQLLQSVVGSPLDVVAQRALEHIVALSGAPSARMYLMESGRPILYARHGDEGSAPPLETEVVRLLATFHDGHARTRTTSAFQPTPEETSGHTLLPLVVTIDGEHHAVGAVAIFECGKPERLTMRHLQQIAVALRASAITVVDPPGAP